VNCGKARVEAGNHVGTSKLIGLDQAAGGGYEMRSNHRNILKVELGCGYGSVVEHMLSVCEFLGVIPRIKKIKNKGRANDVY
jgi:hypothetical protein